MNLSIAALIPFLPLLAAIGCLMCAMRPSWRGFAGTLCVGGIGLSFLLTLALAAPMLAVGTSPQTVAVWNWLEVGRLTVPFGFALDGLTLVMLLVITGIGSLIAVYATGYMRGDRGYARFFAAMSLFIFAMTVLVMADNLVLLFLGWEGVGLCSYLLIGYYFQKPEAVAAAKKAFIVNRIGDAGLLVGMFLTYQVFGTLSLHGETGVLAQAGARVSELAAGTAGGASAAELAIPLLLMLGAFGKSAQLPLYVWLPDAMAGPTPVSALVHAATMVTAGVYLIARMMPVFELSPVALPLIATVGGVTALYAACIALTCNDLKGVFAYSTVSQLGYMFLGLGALSATGGVFHLVTHAFFKALLFLTAGSVMHALAGQLDLRRMSGLRHRMPVTCVLMAIGCVALAGFPFTAGFYSKDLILGDTLGFGLFFAEGSFLRPLYLTLAALGLLTAFLTAVYTTRVWVMVFLGAERFEMGDEHHDAVPDPEAGSAAEAEALHDHPHPDEAQTQAHAAVPHEMPWWPMNAPLVLLAAGALFAGVLLHGPMAELIHGHSTAEPAGLLADSGAEAPALSHISGYDKTDAQAETSDHPVAKYHHTYLAGVDAHTVMLWASVVAALSGILTGFAAFNRVRRNTPAHPPAGTWVDRLSHTLSTNRWYSHLIVTPLRVVAQVFWALDGLVVNGLSRAVGVLPAMLGRGLQPVQSGKLQGYGLGMVLGMALLALMVLLVLSGQLGSAGTGFVGR